MDPGHLDGLVPVLEADPDLAAALDEAEQTQAGRAALAPALHVARGAWHPPKHAEPGHMGFLVLGGLLCRSVSVAGARSVELLAAGDVIRPWVTLGDDAPSDLEAEWTVIEPAILASLDSEFARRVASWPALCGAIMDRLVIRSRWLALDLALSHVRRVDDRLMLLFWQLGRRWGRVSPEGVIIPFNLQHQLLATLIGAQRPSVTTRLGVLRDEGLLVRRADGTWLLPNGTTANVLGDIDLASQALAVA